MVQTMVPPLIMPPVLSSIPSWVAATARVFSTMVTPAFSILLSGKIAERGCYFGQDLVLRVDHRDRDIFFTKVPVEPRAAANELVDLAGNFDTTETSAYDDEAEVPPAAVWIARGLGIFHLLHDVLAKIDGVAHDLKREGVIGHSRNNSEIAFRAAGEDYVVVVQAI